MNSSLTKDEAVHTRPGAPRGPWAVLCAAVTVVLGPAAVTASALDQANAAPLHRAVEPGGTHAYLPADTSRRKAA
ncbi:hypothetical protein ABZ016_00160 [Streptomyces sp. NPDC006372]|uniref:hypothetical protein n=1 Tax=Streptomyces sp. NPDC006372 TaxID=3155599 RepID=UPI0033AAC958